MVHREGPFGLIEGEGMTASNISTAVPFSVLSKEFKMELSHPWSRRSLGVWPYSVDREGIFSLT